MQCSIYQKKKILKIDIRQISSSYQNLEKQTNLGSHINLVNQLLATTYLSSNDTFYFVEKYYIFTQLTFDAGYYIAAKTEDLFQTFR